MYYLLSGIRGEINVLVKVELFNDLNRFRQSSCGVKFFCSTSDLSFGFKIICLQFQNTSEDPIYVNEMLVDSYPGRKALKIFIYMTF